MRGRNILCYSADLRGVADGLLEAFDPVKKRGTWAVAYLRVVTPCFAVIPVRKMTNLRGPAPLLLMEGKLCLR